MKLETFFEKFDLLAEAPGGVAKLRELVLELAVRGRLLPQRTEDEDAEAMLGRIGTDVASAVRDKRMRPPKAIAPYEGSCFDIPRGWVWSQLGRVVAAEENSMCDGPFGSKLKTEHYVRTPGYAVVRLGNIGVGRFISGKEGHISRDRFESLSSNHLLRGDLIVAGLADPLLRCCEIPSELGPAVNKADCFRIRVHGQINRTYVQHYLNSPVAKSFASEVNHGMTRERINLGSARALPIPIPPAAEQHRIVVKVDELMALCDRLEAQHQDRETRRATLAQAALTRFAEAPTPANLNFLFHGSYTIDPADLRKAILSLAVRGRLVEQTSGDEPASTIVRRIHEQKARSSTRKTALTVPTSDVPYRVPEGWAWVRWDQVALKIGDIHHKMPATAKEGVPYISPRDFLPGNRIDFDHAKRISLDDFARLSGKIRPEVGDLIFPRYGTVGGCRLVTDRRNFLASYSCAVIKVGSNQVEPRYQYYFAQSDLCIEQARAAENKTTQANVGIQSIKEFLFPLPPLAEQRRIVDRVDQLMALVDLMEAHSVSARGRAGSVASAAAAELITCHHGLMLGFEIGQSGSRCSDVGSTSDMAT